MRRAEGPEHPQQRGPVLRRLDGVHRNAAHDRAEPVAEREPRTERASVLPRAVRLAGHRTEVPRDARSALEGTGARRYRSTARLARSATTGLPAGSRSHRGAPGGAPAAGRGLATIAAGTFRSRVGPAAGAAR